LKETAGRPLRRHPAQASPHGRPHRPAAGHVQFPAQRADPPAPRRALRNLRVRDGPPGPPRSQARRSQQARPTGETRLDAPHGHATAQDPGNLPPLPRRHPRWTSHQAHPTVTTRERGAGKARTPRSGRDRRKRTRPQAPRQRSTSLGEEPRGNDPAQGHPPPRPRPHPDPGHPRNQVGDSWKQPPQQQVARLGPAGRPRPARAHGLTRGAWWTR
jgi:hypothetical protein